MEEKKFVKLKKEEYNMKEYIKKELGKGKISSIKIEYTPMGEKITIKTTRPGFVIGRKGERINKLTDVLKKSFSLENPQIDIDEIEKPEFDSQFVADEIARSLERFGSLRFKAIAYKMLERIVDSGALGVEIRLSGKLPSERARTWRFTQGYLKKTGETSKTVDRSKAIAKTPSGMVGIKVGILPPTKKVFDRVNIGEVKEKVKENKFEAEGEKNSKEGGEKESKKKGKEK